jgi:hypothetical protein
VKLGSSELPKQAMKNMNRIKLLSFLQPEIPHTKITLLDKLKLAPLNKVHLDIFSSNHSKKHF